MREAAFKHASLSGITNGSFDLGNPLNMSTEEGGHNQVFVKKLNRLDKGHLARTIEDVVLRRHSKKEWKPPCLGFKATIYKP